MNTNRLYIFIIMVTIGLSVNYEEGKSMIAEAYYKAVIKSGAAAVLIPMTTDEKVLTEVVSRIDGLILTGGGDIYSPFFGEELHPTVTDYNIERDKYDLMLVRLAHERQMPIFGICRGHQVINVAFGGTLIQDIPSQAPESKVQHRQTESREIPTHAIKSASFKVNSVHHQAVKDVAPGFEATAFAEDGIVEAIRSTEGKMIHGVQWHPENLAVAGDAAMISLFSGFKDSAAIYSRAKKLSDKIITLDSHTDTPMWFEYGIDIGKENPTLKVDPKFIDSKSTEKIDYDLKVDIPKMQKGMLDAVVMVAYIPQKKRTEEASNQAVEKTFSILKELRRQIRANKKVAGQAFTAGDVRNLKKEGRKAIILGLENGYGIGKDIKNIKKLADMGVAYITLSHNGHNDICDSHRGKPEHDGLSDFGRQVVEEMNRQGIMVDISHTSEKTSFDVLEISDKPVIASHSSAKAKCSHTRNISDRLMKAIADKGGVIQICLYSGFIKKQGPATVADAVDHIDYIVKKVGIDYVGIGSDFDGGGELSDCRAANELPQITFELIRRGYSDEDIEKIWGGNFMRVWEEVKK